MSEIRRDRTTGDYVIIAPERGRRPLPGDDRQTISDALPDHDPSCPFCPGQEQNLPPIIEESACAAPPGWSTRTVPNKYPALRPDAEAEATGFGHHEVIIETPRHNGDLPRLGRAEARAVVETYHSRYTALSAAPGIKSVTLFRNHGGHAGASLLHPHAQVMATGFVPPRQIAQADWARAHHAQTGRCPTCDLLAEELEDSARLVEVSDGFLTCVPFAAGAACEMWIIPRMHQPSFAQADSSQLDGLTGVLQRALYRLGDVLDDPPYNFAVESAPAGHEMAAFLHWRLRIRPVIGRPGGFELATAIPINSSLPEEDAKRLRAVILPERMKAD